MSRPGADLSALEGVVSPKILDALHAASNQLTLLGIRHALVGGLAVGAHGVPRATKDVDFLVGDEAFEHHAGGLVTLKPGVPIQFEGVLIDLLSVQVGEGALHDVPVSPPPGEVPVAPVEALIHLKLKSPRMKDASDVVELLKVGIGRPACRKWLEDNAPHLLPRFEELAARADAESE